MKKCRYCQKEKEDVIYTEHGDCCQSCYDAIIEQDFYE